MTGVLIGVLASAALLAALVARAFARRGTSYVRNVTSVPLGLFLLASSLADWQDAGGLSTAFAVAALVWIVAGYAGAGAALLDRRTRR